MRTQRTTLEAPTTDSSSTTQPRANNSRQPVPSVFMQRAEVLAMACVCTSTLYDWMSIGAFPKPVSLGPRRSNGYSSRAVWVRAEVEAWAQAKIDQARTAIADRPRYSARQAAHA